MPYSTIPTLSDGQILTASHLNLLADNANYLGGLGGLPNVAFAQWRTSTGGSKYWHMRHRHRYLKALCTYTGNPDYFKVYFNGTLVINDGDPSGTNITYTADLNPLGLSVGTWYEIRIDVAFVGGTDLALKLLWETPT